MKRLPPYQIRKLERQIEATGARELKHRLETAQARVNRRIASMARDPKAATSKRFRDALEAEITRIYASLSLDFDKWLGDIVKTGGPAWAGETAGQIMQATGKKLPLMRFDRERVQRYQEMITKENGEHLAAVFTRSMTDASIRQLRNATVDTFRQQVIEGWTANETHKRLQQSWDRLAGNESGRRFVDRGGNEWTNSRYLQMLTRTTMQRVSREIEIDTLADNGFSLARISSDAGDPCPICEAWQGVVIRVAGSGQGGGRFPTYQQSLDAGMWHPNCTHRLEYIDEDLEADEIKQQAEQPSPGAWEDPDAVREYSDKINQQRYRDGGMSAAEARRAVMRDRLKDRARSGMVSERFDDAIDAIPDKVLDQMRLDQLPHFRLSKKDEEGAFSRNSPRGGWVVLDRKTAADDGAAYRQVCELAAKRGVMVGDWRGLRASRNENEAIGNFALFKDTVTPEEKAAILAYTRPGSTYRRWNKALRTGDESELTREDRSAIRHLDAVLAKAPKHEGRTFRGIGFDKPEIERKYRSLQVGSIDVDRGFLSTSFDHQRAEDFAVYESKNGVVQTIEGRNGVPLFNFSAITVEKEVLYPRETGIVVLHVGGDSSILRMNAREL